MTATGHALVGAAIVFKIPDLRVSLPLILASHFLGDALPHWDTGTNWREKGMRQVFFKTLIDVTLSYLLTAIIFIWWLHGDPISIGLAVLVSQLPDFLEIPYFFLNWQFAPWTWINSFQHLFHRSQPLPWGLVNQLVITILFLTWALT